MGKLIKTVELLFLSPSANNPNNVLESNNNGNANNNNANNNGSLRPALYYLNI